MSGLPGLASGQHETFLRRSTESISGRMLPGTTRQPVHKYHVINDDKYNVIKDCTYYVFVDSTFNVNNGNAYKIINDSTWHLINDKTYHVINGTNV